MKLSAEERLFVEKREILTRRWPWVGGILLLLLATLTVWLWLTVPYLVNPWAVSAGFASGTMPESTTLLMAAMLPVVMLTLLVMIAIVVTLAFVAFHNERRLIGLVQRLLNTPGSVGTGA